jgi:hypothetical protein
MGRRLRRVLLLAAALTVLIAASASAATRYAAPGGTGSDPCADSADPCSIYTAADVGAPGTTIANGDVVELAPGTYSETAGDLGAADFVNVNGAVTVRGEPGAPRPLIRLEDGAGFWGAFIASAGARVVGLDVVIEAGGSAISISQGGTGERVVARSTAPSSFTCSIAEGTLRDSACLHEGGGVALGTSTLTFVGTHSVTLRNVTAIGTGPGSVGMSFSYFGSAPGVIGDVKGKAVIASGAAKDVVARGMSNNGTPGNGATANIVLDHSSYADVGTETSGGGTASITTPGTNDNITAEAALAADGYHQLPGSPTVEKGVADGSSGAFDVDGQNRSVGLAPDIGADELVNPTSTTLQCAPAEFLSGGDSNCLVTVEDRGTVLSPPTGNVSFGLVSGLFVTESCTLTPVTEASSSCSATVTALPNALGAYEYKGTYLGDGEHGGSAGSANLTVLPHPSGKEGIVAKGDDPPPATKLGRHPNKRTTKRMAKFTFGSNEVGSSFECKLDRKPFRRCTSPYKKKVKRGSHVFKVRAVDAAGQADKTPVVFRWKVIPAS